MKRKGIVVSLLLALIVSTMPFRIYADTMTGHIVGISRTLIDDEMIETYQYTSNGSTYTAVLCDFTYNYEILFDDYYVGWINIEITQDISTKKLSSGYENKTFTIPSRTYYVNGSNTNITGTFRYYTMLAANSNVDGARAINPSYTLNSSNVTKYEDLNSMGQLIDIMNDVALNVDSIEQHVDNIQDILSDILKIRQWNIPYESLAWNVYMMSQGFNIKELIPLNVYQYPIFEINTNDVIYRYWGSTVSPRDKYTFIFLVQLSIPTTVGFNNNFSVSDGSISNYEQINQFSDGSNTYTLVKFDIDSYSGSSWKTINYIGSSSVKFIPIFSGFNTFNVTTDFAQLFSLENAELMYLRVIAEGTQSSQSSSSDLESLNNTMASDMNNMANIESGYSQQFNNQLQNIDFSSPLSNNIGMGQSAGFVISIFNGLIANNPLSILIIVVCILMIAKKVIGK